MSLSAFDQAHCRAVVESHVAGAITETDMFCSLDPILRPYLIDKDAAFAAMKELLRVMRNQMHNQTLPPLSDTTI